MKILYFCPQLLWPANTGARLRNFHLSNALGASCSLTLLQIRQPGEHDVKAPAQASYRRVLSVEKDASYTPTNIIRGLLGPVPITILNYSAVSVANRLTELLKEGCFDAVQLESIHLFGYLTQIRAASNPPMVLLDWHNIESELMVRYSEAAANPAKRLVALRTARLLAKTELFALESCDAHTVVSDREKQNLLARFPNANIHVIPNGVDIDAYQVQNGSLPKTSLLFVGSMDYHANTEAVTWFVDDIWPAISNSFPDLHFTIVGRNPSVAVRALASETITVTGTVEDVRTYYANAFAVVVPLRVGGGTRLKILEAMAAGVPVISTRLGAEGLDVRDNENILFADTAAEMCSVVAQLLADTALRLRLTDAARRLVCQRYDWAELGKKLAAVHLSMSRV